LRRRNWRRLASPRKGVPDSTLTSFEVEGSFSKETAKFAKIQDSEGISFASCCVVGAEAESRGTGRMTDNQQGGRQAVLKQDYTPLASRKLIGSNISLE